MCLSNQDILFSHIQVSKSRRLKIIKLSLSSFKEILYRICAQSEYNTEFRQEECSTFKEGNKESRMLWRVQGVCLKIKYFQGTGLPAKTNLQSKWSQIHFYIPSSHLQIKMEITTLVNCRITKTKNFWSDLQISTSQVYCSKQVQSDQLDRGPCQVITSKDGDSATSPGDLCQCLAKPII